MPIGIPSAKYRSEIQKSLRLVDIVSASYQKGCGVASAASSRRAWYGAGVDASRHWIVWDGDCGFCRRAVGWVLARDGAHLFQATPYQELADPPMTPVLRA